MNIESIYNALLDSYLSDWNAKAKENLVKYGKDKSSEGESEFHIRVAKLNRIFCSIPEMQF